LKTATAKTLSYGVADTQAWQAGLACGGKIDILIQPIAADFFSPSLLTSVISTNTAGHDISLAIDSKTGTANILNKSAPSASLIITYAPSLRMAIIGAVHIAQQLAPMAKICGFDVLVIDPRGMFANVARMENIAVTQEWPDDALAAWKPDSSSAVIALTHDPKLDDPALVAALRSPAFYVAALGSRKTHSSRGDRLTAMGFSATDIARIHGPAGLAIGAKSPAEIAISILAELIQIRRQTGNALSK
jgi:xanthine dehydrogenase accessory factor